MSLPASELRLSGDLRGLFGGRAYFRSTSEMSTRQRFVDIFNDPLCARALPRSSGYHRLARN